MLMTGNPAHSMQGYFFALAAPSAKHSIAVHSPVLAPQDARHSDPRYLPCDNVGLHLPDLFPCPVLTHSPLPILLSSLLAPLAPQDPRHFDPWHSPLRTASVQLPGLFLNPLSSPLSPSPSSSYALGPTASSSSSLFPTLRQPAVLTPFLIGPITLALTFAFTLPSHLLPLSSCPRTHGILKLKSSLDGFGRARITGGALIMCAAFFLCGLRAREG